MFSKYHGCGNDFIICEDDKKSNIDYSDLTRKICNRKTGIGADTFIVIEKNENYSATFYNADGTIAPMCGNGIRCVAAYLVNNGYIKDDIFLIDTSTGTRKVKHIGDEFEINMGRPDYTKETLSLNIEGKEMFGLQHTYEKQNYELNAIFMTTHHLVIIVNELNQTDQCGEYFCKNGMFEKMINVDFVKIINRKTIKIRTFERGCGWTKACGSGSTASVAVLIRKGLVDNEVKVVFEDGTITITKKNDDFYMRGPAVLIADGINFYYN